MKEKLVVPAILALVGSTAQAAIVAPATEADMRAIADQTIAQDSETATPDMLVDGRSLKDSLRDIFSNRDGSGGNESDNGSDSSDGNEGDSSDGDGGDESDSDGGRDGNEGDSDGGRDGNEGDSDGGYGGDEGDSDGGDEGDSDGGNGGNEGDD